VDTSSAVETLAVAQGDLVLAQWHARRPKHRGASLASTVEAILAAVGRTLSDLSCASVVVGPGAFTGLRVGIATLQGIASARGIPVWGIEALEGWAHAGTHDLVGVTLDARRDELYTGLFRRSEDGLETVRGLDLQTPQAWAEDLAAGVELVGDGARHRARLEEAVPGLRFAASSVVGPDLGPAALAAVKRACAGEVGDPREVSPLYLRRHDGTRTNT
jgi:tRNA threonylcarbamoyladenosine biosynthesis protein TsaB